MYPFNRYQYYITGNKIIAVSTYAGKAVRGVAKCADSDTFNKEKGKQLAALRCAEKIAHKRIRRAKDKSYKADAAAEAAKDYADKMYRYVNDAYDELEEIEEALEKLLEDM